MKNYCVYVHIFPNGKKYYGISKNIDKRWKNGKGYKGKPEMYKDILKYGWNNIEHIILKENLNFYEAQNIENELIYKNSTNDKNKGYNHFFGHKGNYEFKTYPLQFTEEYLKHIEEVAKKQGKTIKDFILEAIKEKIEKLEKGE